MILIDSNNDSNNISNIFFRKTTSTLSTGLIVRNSTIDEKKLINSINILKNIIERISKGPSGEIHAKPSADSFQNIFALAKESVTLSFKDYLLIHKTTTAKSITTQNNHVHGSLLSLSNSSSLYSKASSFPITKQSSGIITTIFNAKSFLNEYMQLYFNSTKSSLSLNQYSKYSNNSINSVKTNSNYGDLLKFLLENTTRKFINNSSNLTNYNNINNNTLLYMSKFNSSLTNNLFDFLNSQKSNFDSTDNGGINSFIPNTKEHSYHSGSNISSLLIGIAFFYSFLILTSLISNPLLIYVLLWRRKAQIKLIDIFVANLSLSDLFLTIFNIPLCLIIYFSEQWPFGSLLCQLGTYSTSCSIYVNIFTMAFISIDRYFAVTRPMISNPNCQLRKKSASMDNTTRRKIYMVLTIIWIVALVLSLPQFLFSKVSSRYISGEKEQLAIKSKLLTDKVNKTFLKSTSTDSYFNTTLTTPPDPPSSTTNTVDLFNDDYGGGSDNTLEELENFENLELLDRVDFGEDPFKKCILEYPLKDMKNYMILINFSLQYLIPSIVILYFYGKIIYHLYLNLNVEDLMEMPAHNHNGCNNKDIRKVKSSLDIDKVNQHHPTPTTSFLTYKIKMHKSGIAASTSAMNTISDQCRQGGLNRTRNLKKSIKVMIIIIALFLLSWLPIQLYRLVTTFYPILAKLVSEVINSNSFMSSSTKSINSTTTNELCKRNLTSTELKECLYSAIDKLNNEDTKNLSLNYKLNTLHNRYVFFFSYCMAMSSVCYNPIVYFWMHKKFRAEVNQLFSRVFRICSFKSKRGTTGNNNNLTEQEIRNKGGYTTTRNQSLLPTQTNIHNSNNIYNKKYSACVVGPSNKNNNSKFGIINNNRNINKPSTNSQIEPLNERNRIASKKKHNKNSGILNSFKFRSNRFSSLSSESTASSSKKSVQL
jgi:hypothetical protein